MLNRNTAPSIPSEPLSPASEPASAPGPIGNLTERNVRMIVEVEQAAKAASTRWDRIAMAIAGFCGTMVFAWVQLAWVSAWIVVNAWPGREPFDPFPFSLLGVVVSLEAVLLSTFILVSQNRENVLAQRRSHLDLQINLLTEQENTEMLRMLRSIADTVGAPLGDHPDRATLERATQPHLLAQEIEKAGAAVAPGKRSDADHGTPAPTT